jgi:superfamily II RNA helicase
VKSLQRVLDEARRIISPLVRRERSLTIEGQLEPLDANLSMAVWAWSEGCLFEDLVDYTTTSDGDLVRAFRHTVDLLRQVRRAVEGDPALQDKLQGCIYRLNRGVVDAERQLRISEEADLRETWEAEPRPEGEERREGAPAVG